MYFYVYNLQPKMFSMLVGYAPQLFTVFTLLAIFAASCAQNFETGDNSTVHGCSNHCSYKDQTLDCWNNTLVFFEKILLGQMRNYVAVQMNINQWRMRHVHPFREEFEQAKQHSIETMRSQLHHEDIITEKTIETVVNTLVDLAALQTNHTMLTWMPHFQCPIPCEHRYTVWRNLFILSSILNMCLFVAILPLVKRMHGGDATEALIQSSRG